MKKLTSCLIAAVSAFAGISSVAAAGSCTIKEAPDQALQDYLKGIDNLVTAAANQGGKGNCQTPEDGSRTATSDVSKAQSSVIGSVNKALTTSNVVTSFRYTVNLIRRTELPAGIRRDHAQLDRRQRALMSAIDAVSSSCGSETVFESDVSPYAPYSTEGRTVGKVLEEALTNHTDVMELYRETVL
ncbi:MAG: hypothetical protein QG650_413 [Patescibacteria group bacterium]|nr:hypothetical protein [Patescibacteria group bacterium]